jgi:hypothetical protein
MIAERNFRQSEFRERVTEAILEVLADLPETQRNIFVWNHYRGFLDAINSILYRRTRSLLKEDAVLDSEIDLPVASSVPPTLR